MTAFTYLFIVAPIALFIVGTPALIWTFAKN